MAQDRGLGDDLEPAYLLDVGQHLGRGISRLLELA